jgi:heptosyltransferase I
MNILIVKLSSLGDVVQTMPVVADMLAIHPNAHIDWVVEEAFAPLVERLVDQMGLRSVIPCGLRRWRKAGMLGWFSPSIRAERAAFKAAIQAVSYDAVIDCQGLTKSALVARMAKLAQNGLRGSFANKSDACGYEWPVKLLLANNQPMPKRIHAVARTRLLVAKMLGYESRTDVWQAPPVVAFKGLPVKSAVKKMMFAHGTTRTDNEWQFDNWNGIAGHLIEASYVIVVPHANEHEQNMAESLASNHGKSIHVLPRMHLSQLLDEMSTCAGVIGVDSGLSHMAVALGLPHVQIFSQDRAWRAGPLPVSAGGVAHQIALGGTSTPDVDAVWQAWLKVSQC